MGIKPRDYLTDVNVVKTLDTCELDKVYVVSIVRLAELLSKCSTSGCWLEGEGQCSSSPPSVGRNGYLLTDHLPPIKMTKVYHRLQEIQKEAHLFNGFELRFGGIGQWSTGIMKVWFCDAKSIAFSVEQFGDDYTEEDIEQFKFLSCSSN